MIVLRATESGMCFGVRDALATVEQLPDPTTVTIHGELVHNPEVQRQLAARGFRSSPEGERPVPTTPSVLITAHGVSERERDRLRAAGRELIDTTCPLVHKAHAAAMALAAEGRFVVVLGQPGHVEVRGLVEDLTDGAFAIVATPTDVRTFAAPRLGVLSQTTTTTTTASELLAAIIATNPHADVRWIDTICAPTKARQQALDELLPRVDALVVVGGRHSNNTRKLCATAAAAGVPAQQVEHRGELDFAWLARHRVVGLTAGTSTLPATIDAVEQTLRLFAARAG